MDMSLKKNFCEKFGCYKRSMSGEAMALFLQRIVDDQELLSFRFVLTFFEMSDVRYANRVSVLSLVTLIYFGRYRFRQS